MTWIPSVQYIIALFENQIEQPQLINQDGLISTLDKVRWGIPFHDVPTIWDQVTILFKEIVENHYFMDGNKRIGILLAYIFLNKNGYDFIPPKDEIFSFTMAVAQILKSFDEIKTWFFRNSQKQTNS
jgi:death-on-curing family protein